MNRVVMVFCISIMLLTTACSSSLDEYEELDRFVQYSADVTCAVGSFNSIQSSETLENIDAFVIELQKRYNFDENQVDELTQEYAEQIEFQELVILTMQDMCPEVLENLE